MSPGVFLFSVGGSRPPNPKPVRATVTDLQPWTINRLSTDSVNALGAQCDKVKDYLREKGQMTREPQERGKDEPEPGPTFYRSFISNSLLDTTTHFLVTYGVGLEAVANYMIEANHLDDIVVMMHTKLVSGEPQRWRVEPDTEDAKHIGTQLRFTLHKKDTSQSHDTDLSIILLADIDDELFDLIDKDSFVSLVAEVQKGDADLVISLAKHSGKCPPDDEAVPFAQLICDFAKTLEKRKAHSGIISNLRRLVIVRIGNEVSKGGKGPEQRTVSVSKSMGWREPDDGDSASKFAKGKKISRSEYKIEQDLLAVNVSLIAQAVKRLSKSKADLPTISPKASRAPATSPSGDELDESSGDFETEVETEKKAKSPAQKNGDRLPKWKKKKATRKPKH